MSASLSLLLLAALALGAAAEQPGNNTIGAQAGVPSMRS